MSKNRIRGHAAAPSDASAVPAGFILISVGVLPAPLAEATAAQLELYRLAYEQARQAVDSARRLRRWMFRAALAVTWN
jgi:hypothetical protein